MGFVWFSFLRPCFFGASPLFLSQKDSLPKLTKTQLCKSFFSEKIQGKHADFLQYLPSFLPRVSGISMDSTFPRSEAFSVAANLRSPASGRGAAFIQYTMFITIMAAAPCHLKGCRFPRWNGGHVSFFFLL